MSAFTDTLVAELERVKADRDRMRKRLYEERQRSVMWRGRAEALHRELREARRTTGRLSLVCGCGRTVTGIPRVSTRKSNERTPNPLVGAGVRSERQATQ